MISGKKVGLRALEVSDLSSLRDWRNNPTFRKNFREVRELNMFNQNKWFDITMNRPTDFMFGIVELSTNELIGAAGILYINWINRSGDFSFYIGKNNYYIDDLGFAKEAADLLIGYGFKNLNLNKIWMELYEFDHKKLEFFRNKFNFKVDGKLRQNCFEEGKYWDSYIISLIKEEYS